MTASELLTPRYEVIADYPSSIYKIGDEHNAITINMIAFFEKYPNIFKKMNWWEKRTAQQMPKRVMSILDDKGDTFDIEEWDMENLIGWVDKKERTCCSLLTFKPEYGYIPID
jgi:hypothetical protein